MKKRTCLAILSSSLVLVVAKDVSPSEKLFAVHVKPLLASKCLACHGDEPNDLKGGLDMRTREGLLRGGEQFEQAVLVPEAARDSYLFRTTTRTIKDFAMPPKEADRLTEQEQGWLRDWIDTGATWPDDARVAQIQETYGEGVRVSTSKALSEDWQNRRYDAQKLWAYRPLQGSEDVPKNVNPIDWFLDQQLAEVGLEPAPVAASHELARRISFGLTGLPPKSEDLATFESDYTQDPADAVRRYASSLMALSHYGERFASHWLDVTRYADSAGFANDYARPNAWRYRDYVIRAFNQDKPFKDFVREQIAGDEMTGGEAEHLIATGFLRMGPWEQTSMSVFKETRQMWLDDVTDSVGQTFLGHAMQCAKCHDHKFDPVPTRDYYRMMAVFSTTQFADRDAAFLERENLANFESSNVWVKAKIAAYEKQQEALSAKINRQRKQETGSAKIGDNGLDPGNEASLARMRKNIERHQLELFRTQPIAFSVYTGHTIQRNHVKGLLPPPTKPWNKGYLENDVILAGGNVYAPSDPVIPGALSAVESLGNMPTSAFPMGQGKRRLALADWIVDARNPLTARVLVNRVWSWHFGQGLVKTPNNFGGTGDAPTHPKLLDYLAIWFMDQGWSVKQLNALIVSSKVYRRSSRHPHSVRWRAQDPKQELYATFLPRRLTAEELRDAMLHASGELNSQVGGLPARPDVNVEVAFQPRQIMGGTSSVYEPDRLPEQRNRRSLYSERLRGMRDPFLEVFNQPGPDDSCERRETSTVAPQALTLFNGEEVHDRALSFAYYLLAEEIAEGATIQHAFQRTLARPATKEELADCLAHWNAATAEESEKVYVAKTYPKQITRTVMAEKTGEPYDFIEIMPAYEDYQPDLQPSDVDARTRGLAQVCLVLFNSNEFAYLD